MAAENLALGLPVVADSVNAIRITRDAWRAVGDKAQVPVLEIEIVCSDLKEHRRRVETRMVELEKFAKPTWNDVLARDYEPWMQAHCVIDTAEDSPERSCERALSLIKLNSTG